MELYTKDDCAKCDRLKIAFDLEALGVKVRHIRPDDPEVLADLAWHELLSEAERGALPILLLDDGGHLNHELPIRRYLEKVRAGL